MSQKTMADVIAEESTKFIKLPFFLTALQLSPLNKGYDVTREVFFRLLDKGLKLHFSEPGYLYDGINISNGDVKCALLRVDEALFNTDVPRESLFSQEIITTESGNKIELAHILIGREEVKHRYLEMGLDTFPWVTTSLPNSESDYIERPTISVNKMEEKLKLKQNLPKEPNRLNQIYKPDRRIIKQKKWDLISDANKTTWKHRDTLTIFEFAFILKGKEPQSKATQRNVTELYPIEFCNFFRELEASSDSSLKMHTLTEINPPTLYSEEWAGTPKFERKQLINWAVSIRLLTKSRSCCSSVLRKYNDSERSLTSSCNCSN